METTKPLVIPEKKEKLDKIKEKYNDMQMSDDVAKKIQHLEIAGKALKVATAIVGVITVIDFFVPDGIPVVDEALLAGATTALGAISSTVENKIGDLVRDGKTNITTDEIIDLGGQLGKIVKDKKERDKSKEEAEKEGKGK